jgi:prepilin-type N-terminal cleavage/methylation domain-containing protein
VHQEHRRGFTLLELLVSIGIIAVLISLLLPIFASVQAQGQAVLCQSHQRTLWQGIMAFSLDNDNHLPGSQFDVLPTELNPKHQCYLRGPNGPPNGWQTAPQAGTIWRYVHDTNAYLCPSRDHETAVHGSTLFTDLTSNGHFDYPMFLSFAGAKVEHLPSSATYTDPATGAVVTIPAPYIVEEQTVGMNLSHMEGGHATSDNLAHIHFGGSYYIATDGSCQFFNEPAGISARDYYGKAPKGDIQSLGQNNHFGNWDGQ